MLLVLEAHADEVTGTLNPGLLLSFTGGREFQAGVGGELSFMHFPNGDATTWGYGIFAQAESRDLDHARFAGGFQTGTFIGFELGLAYQMANDDWGATLGIHNAVFGSIGFLSVGLMGTIPIYQVDGGSQNGAWGWDLGCELKVNIPIPLYGDVYNFGGNWGASGRPLRDDAGDVVLAPVIEDAGWCGGPAARSPRLTSGRGSATGSRRSS